MLELRRYILQLSEKFDLTEFIKQVGPTCGLYSLYNGLAHLELVNKNEIHDKVKEDLNNYTKSTIKTNVKKYTEIGEFFDINIFCNFINDTISQDKNLEGKFQAVVCDLSDGFYEIKNNKEKRFIIVPTNPKFNPLNKYVEGKNILHWVSVYQQNGVLNFINPMPCSDFQSENKFSMRDLMLQHNRLENKCFSWCLYKHTSKKIFEHGVKSKIRNKVNQLWTEKKDSLLSQKSISYESVLNRCVLVKSSV